MGVKIHKQLWGRVARKNIPKLSAQETERLKKYSTSDFLRTTLRMGYLTVLSFWRRHRLASRVVAFGLVIIILFSIFSDVYDKTRTIVSYDLTGSVAPLVDEPIPLYADKLVFNSEKEAYIYNQSYTPGGEVSGDSYAPKIEASFEGSPNYATTVTDPVNKVSITLTPTFGLKDPIKDSNRVVYPINGLGKGASKVYTLKASGVKEDIILREKPSKDSFDFKYDVSLSDGLEMRLEGDGSVGVYGVDPALLGNVTTGSEADAKLLDTARKNSKKTHFLFKIPAPFVVEKSMKNISPSVKAKFSVEGNTLTLHASGLKSGSYPLSIDPTIYVETARKLMRGNNETNIDFDVTNELIQKSQTTGARIDSWTTTTNLTSAVYGQGTAVAGGFIYSAGGIGSGTTATTTITSTGTFSVPAGVNYITVKAWGGGGGGGGGTGGTGSGGNGGGGGYAKGVIATTPGETLDITIGAGGAKAAANGRGGNGGSATYVKRSSTYLIEAGAGGGGGGRRGNSGGTTGSGGAGGGATGDAATAGSAGGAGQGGTQVGGGTAGTAGSGGAAGRAGVSQGGGGGSPIATSCTTVAASGDGTLGSGGGGGSYTSTCAPGGGGGGGYYGGGGGGSTSTNARTGGGGGGGSSYINPTGLVAGTDANNDGNGRTPGNSSDTDRAGYADGGSGATSAASASNGDQGVVVISYTATGSISSSVYWAQFNSSTNAIESPNPGTGACSGWCTNSAYNLPTALTNLTLVAYNGFLYAVGGQNSGGTPQTTVYIAKLGANGEPQLWHPTGGTPTYWYSDTALTAARSQFAAVAYNNRMYLFGGLTTSTTVLSSNTVQFADIKPNGTLTGFTASGLPQLSTTTSGNRYGLTAQVYNGYVYILGGDATFSGTPVANVDYAKLNSDGTMNAWVATDAMVSGRLTVGGSFSTIIGGYVYVNGGCSTVNASGYCTAIASDVLLTSINSDGSLANWNSISTLTNDRFAHTMIAWQGGLYRLGGCRSQDSLTGACLNTVLDVDYGVINPEGEASTVATSVTSGTSPCTGTPAPYGCSLPSTVGNMLNATAIINGFLYIMGGCTNNACTTFSSGVTYQAIGSDGTLQKPSSCAGTYSASYCVSYQSLPLALGAPGVTVFNNRIYIVGGFPSVSNIYYATVNYDGSLGNWQNNDTNTGTTMTADAVSYTFAYARANPASAGTNPGNMYIIGGCSGSITDIGCSGYSSAVYKCNITSTGTVTGCDTTGQLQIGTVTGNDGDPTAGGLGAFASAVYANYIYLMGGLSASAPSTTNGTDLTHVRYAKFDDSNNIVAVSGSDWVEGTNEMVTGRRRGSGFGYNGYLYVMGGYDGTDAIADIEFAKIDVSDGSWDAFDQSSVTIQKRWALTSAVSNSYAYVIGGCTAGPAPGGCTTRTSTIQTFQIYNNDSGTPVNYSAGANLFATDRMGAGSAIYNNYIYVAGGCISTTSDCSDATDNTQFAHLDAYGNIDTAWANTTDATLPGERAHGKLIEAGGTLYWIGGQNDAGTAQSDVYYAVPDNSTGNIASWATASNGLPAARSQFGAAEWNDRLYVVAGINSGGTVQNTVYYSPTLSSTSSGGNIGSAWTSSTAPDVARSGNAVVAYANNLYTFGGFDGTNYLNDAQFTQINSDGSVDPWTFTTALPSRLRQAEGFAANGYLYLVGGRTDDTTCASKTLVTPISANTTIVTGNNPTGVGEWFETNVKYSGRRYAGSVSYANGKYYTLGGVCSGFPSVKNRLVEEFSTAATSHPVDMPATVDAGDLLLVLFTNDMAAGGTTTTPAGWTSKASDAQNNAVRGGVYVKVADGTEDATTVDFVTSAAEEASAQVYRIPSGEWSGTTAGVEVSAVSGASTNAPNPASLNPGAWGTENTLWIAYTGASSYTSVTTYPTSFSGGVHNLSNTGTGGASTSSAWFESAVASVDPGAFAVANTTDSVAYTIGIRPSGYALTGSNRIIQTAVYSQPQVAMYSRMIDTDTDVFPTSWLLNGIDNSIGARWQTKYRSMHDISDGASQQNPNEDCGTSSTMPVMTTWGQETNYGDTTLGDVAAYTAYNGSGGNINCARYFYFYVSIDASRTFGYPEDVNRGPTIADLSLFFTSDPSKRLRHGKTFTGGEQQPLDTPCRQSVDAQCPLP